MKTLNFEEMEMVNGGSDRLALFCAAVGAYLDAGAPNGGFGESFIWYQTWCA